MSETILNAEQTAPETPGSGEEAIGFDPVCLEVPRIYDNCGAKDCLRDLTVFFTPENQTLIETATSVRVTKVSVITATVDVDTSLSTGATIRSTRPFISSAAARSIPPHALRPHRSRAWRFRQSASSFMAARAA